MGVEQIRDIQRCVTSVDMKDLSPGQGYFAGTRAEGGPVRYSALKRAGVSAELHVYGPFWKVAPFRPGWRATHRAGL